MALPHGNADAERSFSVNKTIVTKERISPVPKHRNAVKLLENALRYRGWNSTDVNIISLLIDMMQNQHISSRRVRESPRNRRLVSRNGWRAVKEEAEIFIAETEQPSTLNSSSKLYYRKPKRSYQMQIIGPKLKNILYRALSVFDRLFCNVWV